MAKRLVNLTGTTVVFVNEKGEEIRTVRPSGHKARVVERVYEMGRQGIASVAVEFGIPQKAVQLDSFDGLPNTRDDVVLLVSEEVGKALRGVRFDVRTPRDPVMKNGELIGYRTLAHIQS